MTSLIFVDMNFFTSVNEQTSKGYKLSVALYSKPIAKPRSFTCHQLLLDTD